jgi:hypothetical protein
MTAPGKRRRSKPRQTKDRVLQARIPKDLDEELRGHAEQLGLSVSTVVRNVLLNTFELVEGVVVDSTKLARAIQGRKHPPPETNPEDPEPAVVGWQEAVLNLNGICDKCNTILHKGERAAVGVPVTARPVLLCLPCLASLSPPTPPTTTTA